MKNRFVISEEERERILNLHESRKNSHGTVMNEQYAGVVFGNEPNGLKIKKMETKEQAVGAPVASQSNVAAKPKVDQAVVSKVQGSFPKPSKDPATNKMVFLRAQQDSSKYDSVVNFLKGTRLGTMAKVVDLSQVGPDTPNAQELTSTGSKQNSYAMNMLYTGIQALMELGFAKALEDPRIKALGIAGDAARTAAAEYLDKMGVKYNA